MLVVVMWNRGFSENNWNGMVDTIPFPETRSYVKAVLQYQERYEALYGNNY